MTESLLNPLAFATLLTSLYVLRFRGWTRPGRVALYFAFFAGLELAAARWFIPPGAFGAMLGVLCLGLSVPVLVASALVYWNEQRAGETEG